MRTRADMSNFNPINGSLNDGLVGVVLQHVEVPMRTLVALESALVERLDSQTAREIAVAATEEGVADLVTSALALITASWEMAGADFGIGFKRDTPPEVDAWCSNLLDQAIAAANSRFLALRLDYAVNVGPLPR
jgi:hypothetical protein